MLPSWCPTELPVPPPPPFSFSLCLLVSQVHVLGIRLVTSPRDVCWETLSSLDCLLDLSRSLPRACKALERGSLHQGPLQGQGQGGLRPCRPHTLPLNLIHLLGMWEGLWPELLASEGGGLPVSRWFWKTVPPGSFSNDPEAAPCAPNQACPLGSEASVLLLPQLGGWRASAEDADNIPKHRAFDFEDKRVFSDRRFVADLP